MHGGHARVLPAGTVQGCVGAVQEDVGNGNAAEHGELHRVD